MPPADRRPRRGLWTMAMEAFLKDEVLVVTLRTILNWRREAKEPEADVGRGGGLTGGPMGWNVGSRATTTGWSRTAKA